MIALNIHCSMCGKAFPEDVEITIKQDLAPESIKVQIEKLKWIVQFNGDNIDTYCSKQCAR